MEHYALHARRGLWLFHTWEEARALWDRLVAVAPVHHLCIMPDHVHLLVQRAAPAKLTGALSGYARWLGHRWGWDGLQLWLPRKPAVRVTNPEHLERTRRYILLNPCRGALVKDPLEWAFSTHRDATGLAWPRARRCTTDPHDFHAYVTRDPSVSPLGTDLPAHDLDLQEASFEDVLYALSAVSRTPVDALLRKGRARTTLIACARALTPLPTRALASRLGIHHAAVCRARPPHRHLIDAVERAIGDTRFPPLLGYDLRNTPAWQQYRQYLAAKRRARRFATRAMAG